MVPVCSNCCHYPGAPGVTAVQETAAYSVQPKLLGDTGVQLAVLMADEAGQATAGVQPHTQAGPLAPPASKPPTCATGNPWQDEPPPLVNTRHGKACVIALTNLPPRSCPAAGCSNSWSRSAGNQTSWAAPAPCPPRPNNTPTNPPTYVNPIWHLQPRLTHGFSRALGWVCCRTAPAGCLPIGAQQSRKCNPA